MDIAYILKVCITYYKLYHTMRILVFWIRWFSTIVFTYTFTRKLPSEINIALTSNNIKLRDCQPGDFDTSPTSQIAENGLTEL